MKYLYIKKNKLAIAFGEWDRPFTLTGVENDRDRVYVYSSSSRTDEENEAKAFCWNKF